MGSDWGKIDEAEQPGLNPNIGILLAVISVGREGENKKVREVVNDPFLNGQTPASSCHLKQFYDKLMWKMSI